MIAIHDTTPICRYGEYLAKRDDLYEVAGIRGGKVRTCYGIATGGAAPALGLITASARKSPQMQIVARLAHHLGIPCRLHTASGEYTEEMEDAKAHNGHFIQHRPGYNSVIVSRADQDARKHPGWRYIPFGMECVAAIRRNREQVASLAPYAKEIKRIVIVLGSGMTAAGILHGLNDYQLDIPVLGVRIGADPRRRLMRWAPPFWEERLTIVESRCAYSTAVRAYIGPDRLDPHYEAKCVEYLRAGDLLWIVGIRAGLEGT